MKSLKKSGFTLLELLVVISIIAILAVSLTPAFSRAREAARRTTCGQAMGQVHKAITMYEVDYGSYPTVGASGTQIYTTLPQDGLNLLYRQYIDDVRVFSCPSNKMSPTELDTVKTAGSGSFTGSLKSSYGYSPGHDSKNSRVIIMADKLGSGKNSDNHGKNAGQNELSAGGSVSFIPAAPNNASPVNDLGKDDSNNKIEDPNIYVYGDLGTYPEWDSGCL
ncbi:MAG: type II secretion system protein [Planctomycetota bacterium]